MAPNMFDMLRQAQAMQSKVKAFQEEMEKQEFTGTAGGGAVTVAVNGKHEVKTVKISPQALTSGDAAMLQDMVKAAVNDAGRRVNERLKDEMGRMTGGVLPPGIF
jgi:nucleoid-associated protein EbfC